MLLRTLGSLIFTLTFTTTTILANDNLAVAPEARSMCASIDPSMRQAVDMIDLENRLRSSVHFKDFMHITNELTQRLKEADQDKFLHALSQADLSRAEAELGLSEIEAEEISLYLESIADALFNEFPELIDYAPKPSSLIYDPRAQAIGLERILSKEGSIEKINLLARLHMSDEMSLHPHSKDFGSFDGLLFFPPGGGFDDDPTGRPAPPVPCSIVPWMCPARPPMELPEGPPSFSDGECAVIPVIATGLVCSGTGPAVGTACVIIGLCASCEGPEGGLIDSVCNP